MKIAKVRELIDQYDELSDQEKGIMGALAAVETLGPAAKGEWSIQLLYPGEEGFNFILRENNNKIHDEIVALLEAALSKVAARRLIKRREVSEECTFTEPTEEPVEEPVEV